MSCKPEVPNEDCACYTEPTKSKALNCLKCKTPLEHLEDNDFGCPKCLQIYTITPLNKSNPIDKPNIKKVSMH